MGSIVEVIGYLALNRLHEAFDLLDKDRFALAYLSIVLLWGKTIEDVRAFATFVDRMMSVSISHVA